MEEQSLKSPVQLLPGVGPKIGENLARAGINTLEDLLFYLPFRYLDAQAITPISRLEEGSTVTVQAQVLKHQPLKTKRGRQFIITTIADKSAKMTISFFNQSYVLRSLIKDQTYTFTGKVSRYRGRLTLTNPSYELANQESIHTGRIIPIYSQTSELSMRLIRKLLYTALQKAELKLPEYLPAKALKQANLMPRHKATRQVHFPDSIDEAEQARHRLAFDELWNLFSKLDQKQKKLEKEKNIWSWETSPQKSLQQFQKIAPFQLTSSQREACLQIAKRLKHDYPVEHVLQGEVGSGKTMVAAFALLQAAREGQQALYLAPTTILAQQHYTVLKSLANQLEINCQLWISDQKDPLPESGGIVVGTHTLLHHADQFQPALMVVDEEHRFGVAQREKYWHRSPKPHLITMTATPIPRTLARVLFTNQSVSFLDLIPGKEKNITTRLFPPHKLRDHLQWLRSKTTNGDQAFLLAPLIKPSQAEGFEHLMDAHSLYELTKQFIPSNKVGLLTGQDSAAQKEATLNKLRVGEISVLVATPVIEVGIDIPDASVITITSAERFGLAQLHQLRGRVGRQGQASWCFLVPSKSTNNTKRLHQLENNKEGWKLAELDLKQRGVGEFLGTRQSGWDTLEIASWLDLDLLIQVKKLYEEFHHRTI